MNKVIGWLAKVAIGKHLIAGLAKIHNALDGKRSEISAGLLAVVHILKLTEIIPAEQAALIENALLAILPLTLADKASKAIKTIDAAVPDK